MTFSTFCIFSQNHHRKDNTRRRIFVCLNGIKVNNIFCNILKAFYLFSFNFLMFFRTRSRVVHTKYDISCVCVCVREQKQLLMCVKDYPLQYLDSLSFYKCSFIRKYSINFLHTSHVRLVQQIGLPDFPFFPLCLSLHKIFLFLSFFFRKYFTYYYSFEIILHT